MSYENAWNSNDMLKWKSMNWWLLFLNAKLVWKSLWDFNEYRILYPFKGLYNPNVSPYLLVEHGYYHTGSHPEKSNRVQSHSCHVSLIKLDIVAHKFEINNLYILAFLMTNGEISLNSFRNLSPYVNNNLYVKHVNNNQ